MSNVEKMVEHALELRRTGRYDQALNMYTAAIKEEPSNSNLYRYHNSFEIQLHFFHLQEQT